MMTMRAIPTSVTCACGFFIASLYAGFVNRASIEG